MSAHGSADGQIGYGDRARVGAIVPSINRCAEPDLAALAPTDVSFYFTRLPLSTAAADDVRAMGDAVLGAAGLLAHLEPDYVIFNCTAASALAEPGLAERIAEAVGCPAGTTADAIVDALVAVDARRIALLSPYPVELAAPEQEFFASHGFEVPVNEALEIDEVAEWSRIEPDTWTELAVKAWERADVDAVVISCTNIRAVPAIAAIESRTGVPAICSNQAAAWSALTRLGIDEPVPGFGRLFAGPATPSAAAAVR